MHYQNKHQRTNAHHLNSPTHSQGRSAAPVHWATTHLYFDIAELDALMKRFCLALIVVLIVMGMPGLA